MEFSYIMEISFTRVRGRRFLSLENDFMVVEDSQFHHNETSKKQSEKRPRK